MKLEDVEVGKQYQWNGRLFCAGRELGPRLAQTATATEIDHDDEILPIYAKGTEADISSSTNDHWLRPEDLSPLAEDAE